MTNFIFLSGKWWWVKDYPEEILKTGFRNYQKRLRATERYNKDVSKALEGKVEVAPDHQDILRIVMCESSHNPNKNGPNTYQWQPPEGKVYEVDIETEIVEENWMTRKQPNPTGRKVAWIKPVKE